MDSTVCGSCGLVGGILQLISAARGSFVGLDLCRPVKGRVNDEFTMLGVKCSVCFGIYVATREWLQADWVDD